MSFRFRFKDFKRRERLGTTTGPGTSSNQREIRSNVLVRECMSERSVRRRSLERFMYGMLFVVQQSSIVVYL